MSGILTCVDYPSGAVDDATAFITAAGISDSTQQSAIRQLVTDLKAASIWTKMNAIYPFVGGSASSHKFNLKDPRDADAAFRIVWNGTVTHNSNGVTSNGTTGYGDTKLIPSTIFTAGNTHLSAYSRTSSTHFGWAIGCSNSGAGLRVLLRMNDGSGNAMSSLYADSVFSGPDTIGQTSGGESGFFVASRRAANDFELYKNSTSLRTVTGTAATSMPNTAVAVLAQNANGTISGFSTRNYAFISMGLGLTDSEESAFYTAVQAYQTTLGRQV